MPKPVSEQVVVITGASSGIGRATALAFASRGAKVVCAARGAHALEALAAQISAAGGTAIAVPVDVTDPAAVQSLADAAEQRFGRIDTWVNNAAVGVWGRIEDISGAEFDRVMRVNFLGQVHGAHAAVPALRRAGGGVLIGVASLEAARAIPLHGPYTASKFAVRAFHDTLRIELAQERAPITVTTILPASVDTPFFDHVRNRLGSRAKPPPPVYAPELVADTIVYAACHSRREIPVGGAAAALMLVQRLSPSLADAVLSLRPVGVGIQRTGLPDDGTDNVDAPRAGQGRVRGSHAGRVRRRSPFTTLIGRRPRVGDVLLRLRPVPGPLRAAALARTGWGLALLAAPEVLARIGQRPPAGPAALAVARVLGARQLAQAVVTTARPSAAVAAASAAVDTLHAATDVGLAAVSPRWRSVALVDAAVASGLAACGWIAHRRSRAS
ncbi:SDR family oxidoreductase [Actinoplanes sp. NEAU-A12]|uniref:SDR family oxidoreductase n=1 Tax=Actinoplanes sandaracinus TaxID=3045177 RepID=A0ABT6WKG4_9ACTN|nr:SDR family oxidoreductase [Actinoplanes sandaracinus]MDI6100227.1 SDR family oxidoreductase [Actinoplanes sandaracinus]